MQKLLLLTATIIFLCSCKETPAKQTVPAAHTDSMSTKKVLIKDFGKPVFASKKDLSCGMPLTAGLEDTAHYKGKIYGFCSAECKADFVAHAATYVKE